MTTMTTRPLSLERRERRQTLGLGALLFLGAVAALVMAWRLTAPPASPL